MNFTCPHCREALYPYEEALRCDSCGAHFAVREGIPLLTPRADYYFGEGAVAERPVMQRVLAALQSPNWERNLMEAVGEDDGLLLYMLDEARGGFKFLTPLTNETHVLDLGAGYGPVCVSLARQAGHLTAMDLTWERLMFNRWLSRRSGIDNITYAFGGDTEFLPFEEGTFDLVLLNGVLEWVPESMGAKHERPDEAQVRFLREVTRVLRPEGTLYVGIENRFSWRYWAGGLEEHSDLRFVSLLPRRLASAYTRLALGKPYRTWTPTSISLKTLLKRAGFVHTDMHFAFPHYGMPAWFVDEQATDPWLSYRPKQPAKALVHRLVRSSLGRRCWPVLKRLAPTFIATASRGKHARPTFVKELSRQVATLVFGRPRETEVVRHHTGLQGDRVSVVVLGFEGTADRVAVKLPLTSFAEDFAERNYLALERLHPLGLPVPEPLGSGELHHQKFHVESCVSGLLGSEVATAHQPRLREQALVFLERLHQATLSREAPTSTAAAPWTAALDRLGAYVSAVAPTDMAAVAELRGIVDEALSACPARVFGHGDFWSGNLLATAAGDLQAVIDWNVSETLSLPGLDWVSFVTLQEAYSRQQTHLQRVPPERRGYMPVLVALARDGVFERQSFSDHCARLGGGSPLPTRSLVLVEGVRQLAYRLTLFPYPLTKNSVRHDWAPLVELVKWHKGDASS